MIAGMTSALVLFALLVQEDPSSVDRPAPRIGDRDESLFTGDFYTAVEFRLQAILGAFSFALPAQLDVRSFELEASTGLDAEIDEVRPGLALGFNVTYDFTLVRFFVEVHQGASLRSDFVVPHPAAGPPGVGEINYETDQVRIGLERPIFYVDFGPTRITFDVGLGWYDLSAKPHDTSYSIDLPPVTAGSLASRRQNFDGFFARAGFDIGARLVGRLYLTVSLKGDLLSMDLRGTPAVLNFALLVKF
jgi:hypothetical protein